MISSDDFLVRLVEEVPEAKGFVEDKYELQKGEVPPRAGTGVDLYENLLDILTRSVIQPALCEENLNVDLLRRCFRLAEEVYNFPGMSSKDAVYFTVLEPLLESRRYLTGAVPFLVGNIRVRTSRMLEQYEVEGYESGISPL
ncbi:hypothetical protein ACIRQY_12665 [Streptomyces sp. NPDC101490]|uniref:hypothetical protein n=1 Tax=Streptomyces sp. NPDC101490 TaxID=3366143 RepID=UPI0037FF8F14